MSECTTDGNVLRRPDLGPATMNGQFQRMGTSRSVSQTHVLMSRIVVLLMLSVVSASAGYSKLEALSLIESGDNDAAVGSLGEVSRYQIRPHIWREYSASRSWRDCRVSAQVAENHLKSLEETFVRRAGRAPTDFDTYVLWNAGPAYYAKVGFSAKRVHAVIRERAQRFVNLRNVNLAQGPALKASPVAAPRPQPAATAAKAPSTPSWTLAQAISLPAVSDLPTLSAMPRSVVSDRN